MFFEAKSAAQRAQKSNSTYKDAEKVAFQKLSPNFANNYSYISA